MRNIFFILISLGLALTVHAEDFAKILDGTSFLVPTVSVQPRGAIRTALTGFNGYYDGTHLRNEDALVFTQKFAPRWTSLQFGYAISFLEDKFGNHQYAVFFETPIRLAQDRSFSVSPKLKVSIARELRAIHLSLPFSAQVWPRLRAIAFAGFGYREADIGPLKIHPRDCSLEGDCFPESEGAYVHPRGAALEYTPYKNLNLSLEYARTTYYSFMTELSNGSNYARWTEVRQSIAPGLRFTSGEWSLAAGFPYTLSGKTAAEGLIFNLAFQPVGRSRQ